MIDERIEPCSPVHFLAFSVDSLFPPMSHLLGKSSPPGQKKPSVHSTSELYDPLSGQKNPGLQGTQSDSFASPNAELEVPAGQGTGAPDPVCRFNEVCRQDERVMGERNRVMKGPRWSNTTLGGRLQVVQPASGSTFLCPRPVKYSHQR